MSGKIKSNTESLLTSFNICFIKFVTFFNRAKTSILKGKQLKDKNHDDNVECMMKLILK